MRRLLTGMVATACAMATLAAVSVVATAPPASAQSPQPGWTQLSPATSPTPRYGASVAYDPGTRQVVLFGGNNGSYLGDTWGWDGNSWTQVAFTGPPARGSASMAYDPGTGQLVLFGGASSSGDLGDTWTWNGNSWALANPAASPPARNGASLAYDQGTGQLVLFGGTGSDGSFLGDTWTWDGNSWTQASPATSPPARSGASMAYDPGTAQLVLFGGAGNTFLGDTWTWDGATWTQASPATSPPARSGASMAFDPGTAQLVLFGGFASGSVLGDTWAWNGTTWTRASPATSPPARYDAAMAYDPRTGQLVLFGGQGVSGVLADTWSWQYSSGLTATWTQASPATSPPARYDASMAYDPATGQVVLFGGNGNGGVRGDTWIWDGTTWTQANPAASPSARYGASMAYDPGTGQLVLFGGIDSSSGNLGDTWMWDGDSWIPLHPATSPSTRSGASMAYDPGTGQLVLFGGSNGGDLNDTWTWDGTTWTRVHPATSPSSRYAASMAYDPGTGQLVLFGGFNGRGADGDTWTWDGTTWTQLSPPTSPSARTDASMAYDPGTAQLVLFGGQPTGTGVDGDTWAWDGTTWTQANPATSPSARYGASMAYDPGTAQLVLFGGWGTGPYLADTWTWAPQAIATTTSVTVNPTQVTFGGQVTLSAQVSPSSNPVPTGTVTFTDTANGQTTAVASNVALNGSGMATATVTPPAVGVNAITATYSGEGVHNGSTSSPVDVSVRPTAHQVVVTQLRFSGPGGVGDSYIDIENTSSASLPLAGWSLGLALSVGTGTEALPSTATLPPGGAYLLGGPSYSLNNVATPDALLPTAQLTGVQIIPPPDGLGDGPTDKVGYPVNSGYYGGAGLPPLGYPTDQYAFIRQGSQAAPVNSGNNRSDFSLVSTTGGVVGSVQSVLGTPSPVSATSPQQVNAQVRSSLFNSSVAASSCPNRIYTAGSPGTLVINRTITNTTGRTITALSLRITNLTEQNGPPTTTHAWLRVVPTTATNTTCSGGMGQNLSLNGPAGPNNDGGLGTTLSPTLPTGGLANGQSISVAFQFAVDQGGSFSFGYDVDAS